MAELRFALAEADGLAVTDELRARVTTAAVAERESGWSSTANEPISSLGAFSRTTEGLDRLLADLRSDEWRRPTIRDLDVQRLIGHLIGVERRFAAAVNGDLTAGDADHVADTQLVADSQADRTPADTLSDWRSSVGKTLDLVRALQDLDTPVRFHRISLGIDAFLVVRAFEIWTHTEDIRRATGRPLEDPDPETVALMTELAAALLPAGIAATGSVLGGTVRLVLTGEGGGAWDIPLRGAEATRARHGTPTDAHVVVDATEFCRVVSNRSTLERSRAVVTGEFGAAAAVFAGAAALALD